jgi:predicted DNA-binding antitoxin AbrB/MazE fold protein
MSTTVEAIYENGVLRLSRPIDLPEGAPVQVIVIPRTPQPEKRTPAEILAEIAAMATPNEEPTRDARDHDQILYGKK